MDSFLLVFGFCCVLVRSRCGFRCVFVVLLWCCGGVVVVCWWCFGVVLVEFLLGFGSALDVCFFVVGFCCWFWLAVRWVFV